MADRGGIRGRIFLLVSLAALLPLAAAALVGSGRVERLEAVVLEERSRLARVLGARVESAIEAEMAGLSGLAGDARLDPGDRDDAPERQLLEGRNRSPLLAGVLLAAHDGRILARSGPVAHACDLAIAAAAGGPRLLAGDSGAVCLAVPLDAGGRAALAGGEVDTSGAAWRLLLRPPELDGGFLVLLDGAGRPLSSGAPSAAAPDDGTDAGEAALPIGDLRVRVVQPGPPASAWGRALRALAALAAPIASGVVLLFAWGAARSLTRPLAALGQAAERIATGDLQQPLPAVGGGEVGQLGRSLETMRQALERSLEAAARAHGELERRVEERTRELERLNRELRERERARGELLRKVITAQEDERKRIARELHDESCQALSAAGHPDRRRCGRPCASRRCWPRSTRRARWPCGRWTRSTG